MKFEKTQEDTLFLLGWSLAGITCLLAVVSRCFPVSFPILPCAFHSLLGIYCPGCGGTRAVIALFHGQLLHSLICHPIVLYTAFLSAWFLISQSLERLTKHRIKIGMKYRNCYVWIALAIVIVNFLVKNILLIGFHIDLLA